MQLWGAITLKTFLKFLVNELIDVFKIEPDEKEKYQF